MARHDDGKRVSPIGCAHGPGRPWVSQLSCELRVASGFAKRDREQSLPNIVLKTGASDVEGDGEVFSESREVFAELTLGFDKNRMLTVLSELAQAHAVRGITFPEYRNQAFVTGDQFELSDRGWHGFIEETHRLSFPLSRFSHWRTHSLAFKV